MSEWVSEWVSEWSPFESLRNLMNDYVIHELKMNKNEQSLFVERVAKVKSCSVPFSCFIGIVLSLSKLLDFEWLMPVQFKCNTSANYNPLQRFWKLVRRNPENPKLANILVQINPKLNLKPFSMGWELAPLRRTTGTFLFLVVLHDAFTFLLH